MTELRVVQIDAFADRPFTGNSAAVIALGAWLADHVLQEIAAENGVSATAFAVPAAEGDADYALRWFSPAAELQLCGHATLASGHALIGDRDRIRFRVRDGSVLEVARAADGYELSLPARKAVPKPLPAIAAALGCAPRATLWHPNRYALLVLASEAEVRSIDPDFAALGEAGDVQAIATAPGADTDIVSRVFTGGAEDPVTGSAHAVSIPYWAERLGRDRLTACQASRRGGRLTARLAGDRVILGGQCVTVLEGVMKI